MSLSRLLSVVACAFSLLSLSSCGLGGRADAVNPTVAEMDALDVQWGMTPRKPKGGPRRSYQYIDTGSGGATGAGAAPAAAAPARENVSGPPPASAAPAAPADVAPQPVPSNLR